MNAILFFALFISHLYAQENEWILDYIDTCANFPVEGVDFKWYGRLLRDPEAFSNVMSLFKERYENSQLDRIAALDSRGFIFASILTYELKVPLVLIRKKGKLPGEVYAQSYGLHYGNDCFELEKSAIAPGMKVLIVDDVLATGGTSNAAAKLIEMAGAQVYEAAFLEEIENLKGREALSIPVFSLIKVSGR